MDLLPVNKGEKDDAADVVHRGRFCHPSRAKLFLVSIISFVIASMIVLLVALTRLNASNTAATSAKDDASCLFSELCNNNSRGMLFSELGECPDWAIIGTGLTGSYAAWRLQTLYGGSSSIVLYERSSRIGGRLLSIPILNSSVLEFGTQYFLPELNPTVSDTIHDMGLQLEGSFGGTPVNDVLYHYRGIGLRETDLRDPNKMPYNMDADEQGLTAYELCKKYIQVYFTSSDDTTYDLALNHTIAEPQIESVQQVLKKHASPEAIELIQHGMRSADYPPLGCNGHQLLDVIDTTGITSSFDDLRQRKTIRGGMVQLPVSLVDTAVAEGVQIKFESQLKKVSKGNNYHLLHFETGPEKEIKVSCAKSLVLAIPPPALRLLEFEYYHFEDDFQDSLRSFNELTALRIFLSFSYPWWRNATTHWRALHTNLPISHVEEVASSTGDSSYVLCISVANYIENDWEQFILSEDTTSIAKQLQRTSGLSEIPEITNLSFHTWNEGDPLWYSWKSGVDWDLIGSKMIQPLPGESLYLVGSAFAPGALQQQLDAHLWIVNRMLKLI